MSRTKFTNPLLDSTKEGVGKIVPSILSGGKLGVSHMAAKEPSKKGHKVLPPQVITQPITAEADLFLALHCLVREADSSVNP